MVILTIQNLGNLNFPLFFGFCLSDFPYSLTAKQKRTIQITQILIVSITISYIFCALDSARLMLDKYELYTYVGTILSPL